MFSKTHSKIVYFEMHSVWYVLYGPMAQISWNESSFQSKFCQLPLHSNPFSVNVSMESNRVSHREG